jgi:hypothetical protein
MWAHLQFLCVVATAMAAWWGQHQYVLSILQYKPTRGDPGLQHLQQMVIAAANDYCSYHPK